MNAEDDAIERLRAADPAAGNAPDLASLRRAVDARITEQDDDVDSGHVRDRSSGPGARPAGSDELADRRRRRGPQWVAAAAVAALIAVGGYALGSNQGGGPVAGADGQAEADGQADADVQADADAVAPQASSPGAEAGAGDDGAGAYNGSEPQALHDSAAGYEFDGAQLPTQEGQAPAFGYVQDDPRSVLVDIAGSLGLDGDPVQHAGSWRLQDGGVLVEVQDGPLLPVLVTGLPASDPDPLGAAGRLLRDLARPEVMLTEHRDGIVLGYEPGAGESGEPAWRIEVRNGEVVQALGQYAITEPLGDYQVVSAAEAADRLTDSRFSSLVWADPADDVAPVPQPSAGAPLPWPVTPVVFTGSELVTHAYVIDGVALALPTWLLTAQDGSRWAVPAVAESELDLG